MKVVAVPTIFVVFDVEAIPDFVLLVPGRLVSTSVYVILCYLILQICLLDTIKVSLIEEL